MKRVYISLYKKTGIENLAAIFEKSGWEIYSALSTHKYLLTNNIQSKEIKTDIHPNLALISSFSQTKNIYSIPKMDLIIADIPQDLDDEIHNLTLIIAALRKKIPVISSNFERFVEQIKIFGEINKQTIIETENETLNFVSYLISKTAYSKYPYINEKLNYITIPLSKVKELKYGENPHQKAYLYLTPFKGNYFEIIKGELTTNHFFDIKKAFEIMNDIDIPFLMTLNHSNINYFNWENITQPNTISGHCAVFNGKINTKLFEHLLNLGIKMFIVRDIEDECSKIIKKLSEDDILILKIPHYIKPPKESEIFYFEQHLIVEEKNIQPLNFKTLTSKKIETEINEKIKVGLAIVKHLKTFSAAVFRNKELKGYSQGNPTTKDAIKKALYQALDVEKNTKLLEKFDKFTIVLDGPITSEIANLITNYPVDALVSPYADESTLKIFNEKNIILIVSEKRYYKHI